MVFHHPTGHIENILDQNGSTHKRIREGQVILLEMASFVTSTIANHICYTITYLDLLYFFKVHPHDFLLFTLE
ncbi:hypothetical protein ACJX0J_020041, partial [Zea mays]